MASRVLFAHLVFAHTWLVSQQRRIQNLFKHLKWSVFAYLVNDFKPLTLYAKHSLLDV